MAQDPRSLISDGREQVVQNAIFENDVTKLREISLLPGGFKEARRHAWPYLLGVEVPFSIPHELTRMSGSPSDPDCSPRMSDSYASLSSDALTSSQCEYDTTNSNSRIMRDIEAASHPDERQVQLDTDRSFVLYPGEGRSQSRRKLQDDLHDIILGVLRKRSTLRYFQGYHDIITVLFLTLPSELVLPCAEKLSLHRLRDSMGQGLEPLIGQLRVLKRLLRMIDQEYAQLLEQNSPLPYYALSNLLTLFAHDVPTLPLIQHIYDWLFCREPVASIWLTAVVILNKKDSILTLQRDGDEAMGMMHADLSTFPPLAEGEEKEAEDFIPHKKEFSITQTEVEKTTESLIMDVSDEKPSKNEIFESDPLTASWAPESLASELSPKPLSEEFNISDRVDSPLLFASQLVQEPSSDADVFQILNSSKEASLPRTGSTSRHGSYNQTSSLPILPLTSLLRQADELLTKYPPSSPELKLTETFGHQSALHTSIFMETGIFYTLKDDEAEACVGGDHVVLPLSEEEQDEETGTLKEKEVTPVDRRRRRPVTIRKGLRLPSRTMVAGAVLLLGVAVAVYAGRQNRTLGSRFGGESAGWVTAWIGTILVGAGDRLGISF